MGADLLTDIGQYLQSKSVGTVGTNIFRGFLPDEPDICLALYETGGFMPDRVMASEGGAVQKNPGLQVVGRATAYDYSVARALVQAAYDALLGMAQTTLNGTRYNDSWPMSEPRGFGRDKNGRVLISCNVIIRRDP